MCVKVLRNHLRYILSDFGGISIGYCPNPQYLRYFRDLRNGTIITEGKNSEDTWICVITDLDSAQVPVNNGSFLIELVYNNSPVMNTIIFIIQLCFVDTSVMIVDGFCDWNLVKHVMRTSISSLQV